MTANKVTLAQARNAFEVLGRFPFDIGARATLGRYLDQAIELGPDWSKQGREEWREGGEVSCGPVTRYGADQNKCLKCGRIWGTDEDKPDCGIL